MEIIFCKIFKVLFVPCFSEELFYPTRGGAVVLKALEMVRTEFYFLILSYQKTHICAQFACQVFRGMGVFQHLPQILSTLNFFWKIGLCHPNSTTFLYVPLKHQDHIKQIGLNSKDTRESMCPKRRVVYIYLKKIQNLF